MNNEEQKAFLSKLVESGVDLVVQIPMGEGAHAVSCSEDDILDFMDDQSGFFAKYHGVSRYDYLQWVAEGYSIRCCAQTSLGARCSKIVGGGVRVTPQCWADWPDDYCHLHSELKSDG